MFQLISGDVNFKKKVLDGVLAGIFIKSNSFPVEEEFIEIGEV
jgi:hypothetical protein